MTSSLKNFWVSFFCLFLAIYASPFVAVKEILNLSFLEWANICGVVAIITQQFTNWRFSIE